MSDERLDRLALYLSIAWIGHQAGERDWMYGALVLAFLVVIVMQVWRWITAFTADPPWVDRGGRRPPRPPPAPTAADRPPTRGASDG